MRKCIFISQLLHSLNPYSHPFMFWTFPFECPTQPWTQNIRRNLSSSPTQLLRLNPLSIDLVAQALTVGIYWTLHTFNPSMSTYNSLSLSLSLPFQFIHFALSLHWPSEPKPPSPLMLCTLIASSLLFLSLVLSPSSSFYSVKHKFNDVIQMQFKSLY